jgi:hypothetical protein
MMDDISVNEATDWTLLSTSQFILLRLVVTWTAKVVFNPR